MARGELLSILGLYQYDDSIFDELVLPSEINKEVLVNNIILDCAEFEILYPNPNILKESIGFWSKSRLKAWEDMKNVLIVENYRPFINLERKEKGYDLETRDLNSQTQLDSNSNADENTLNKISAFNSSNLENKDSSDTSSSSSTNTNSNTDDTGTIRKEYEHTFEGDSAMFTKQNIVEQEMEMRLKYDLYKIIIEEFKMKFCLLIY